MNELALSKKQRTKKNAGGGSKNLPLRRKYEREKLETRDRYGGKMSTTRTPQEIEEIRATMAMPMSQRIARMKAFIDELDVEAAINGTGSQEMRLSGARILVASATEREENGDEDFGSALREEIRTSAVVTPDEYGRDYPARRDEEADPDITQSIQATATEKGITFADALRESDVEPERDLPWAGAKRPLPERSDEEQAELERTINERMEQQKENYLD